MSGRLLGDLVTIALGFRRPAKDKQHRDVISGVYEVGLFVFLNSFEANVFPGDTGWTKDSLLCVITIKRQYTTLLD